MSLITDWVPEKAAAAMLGRSKPWMVAQRIPPKGRRAQPIPPWYRIGARVYYKRPDIEAFIESCKGRR